MEGRRGRRAENDGPELIYLDRRELEATIEAIVARTLRELLGEARPASAEGARNASGVVQFTVKEYAGSADEALTGMLAAFRRADEALPYVPKGGK